MSKMNGMTKGAGETMPKRRSDQAGDGEDFAFNGQMGDGVNRAGNRYAGNHFSTAMKENYGLMQSQRKGNTSDSPMDVGPSVTRDKRKLTIATAAQGGRINGGAHCEYPSNPDKIHAGSK